MKRKINMLIAFTLTFTYMSGLPGCLGGFGTNTKAAASSISAAPPITAQTGIVADADTGYIYYQKGCHTKMYPASITKIMTGILAVEKGKDADKITVSDDAIKQIPSGCAGVNLVAGERLTQEEALYTMFLRSANDSANVLALHIGGTMSGFVTMMNKRAKELGTTDTHFANANGLPDTNNVTSAYDMALITKKAVEEPKLMKYFGAASYTMPATNKSGKTFYGTLHRMMVKDSYYKYSGVIAGKTGWETMSEHTLVTVAKQRGRTLICVLMKSPGKYSIYNDTITLFNYCFALPSSGSSSSSAVHGAASADYLLSPAAVKAPKAAGKKAASKTAKVKKTDETGTTGSNDNMTAPLLLLAFSICLFAFLAACGRNTKRSRRNVHGNVRGHSVD